VLTTGLAAAAGWALMTLYALSSGDPITRDFIDYMTGNAVLIGAEVEKIIAILLVTGVLMLALLIGRRSLVLAVRGTTERDDLARFFAPEVAARITAEDRLLRPGFGEVRSGAVLVSDIRGFTALAARREPGELVALLVDYQRRMSPVIKRHNGTVDKFLGDGILATFGCASHSHRPAADAIAALDDLCRAAEDFSRTAGERFGEPVRLGFAVVGGDVLCGTVGDGDRLEFTVVGDAVNQAVKLEKANKALRTLALVDAATLDAAREQGLALALDEIEPLDATMDDGRVRRVYGWRHRPSTA
jgi:adenylate cyclase